MGKHSLIISVEEVIDAYNNMAYKSGWDGSIVACSIVGVTQLHL